MAAIAELPKTETADARAAFEMYYDLGPGRTYDSLVKVLKEKKARGEPVPTTSLVSVRKWGMAWSWQDRCMTRQMREADAAEAKVVEDIVRQKKARIAEAQAMRSAGAQGIREILLRIQANDLKQMPLFGQKIIPEKGQPYRVPGLMDFATDFRKLIDTGQTLERKESGEDMNRKFEQLIETLIADLSPEEQAHVRALAFRIARESEREGG